jgi:microcystin-dependent protein
MPVFKLKKVLKEIFFEVGVLMDESVMSIRITKLHSRFVTMNWLQYQGNCLLLKLNFEFFAYLGRQVARDLATNFGHMEVWDIIPESSVQGGGSAKHL